MKIGKVWTKQTGKSKIICHLGVILGHLGPFLGNFGTIVGPHWGYLVPSWGIFVAVLGASWVTLGRNELDEETPGASLPRDKSAQEEVCQGAMASLGPSWGHLGAILGHLGIYLESSWGHPGLH
jgi:hypothetical protein